GTRAAPVFLGVKKRDYREQTGQHKQTRPAQQPAEKPSEGGKRARNRMGIVHRIRPRRFLAQFRCAVGERTVSGARPAPADSQAPPTFAHAPSMPSTRRVPAVCAASSQLEPARATRRSETKSPPRPRSVQPRPEGMATTVRAT